MKQKWYNHVFFYGNLLIVIFIYVLSKYLHSDLMSDISAMSGGILVGIRIEETINNHKK